MKKRILSILMVVCMVVTPLPSTAVGNTVLVSDYNSLKSALTSSAGGTIVQLAGDISFAETITVPSSLTLDLNGHTLSFTGSDPVEKSLLRGITFTGSTTFTVKDSGTDGKLIASEGYSAVLFNQGSGIMELEGGKIFADEDMATPVVNGGSGTLKLSGATVKSEKFYAVINQSNSGKLNMSGGTVSSDSSYALVNYGNAEISGGTVSSNTSLGIHSTGSGSSLTVSGGTVKSISSYAIANNGNSNTVAVTGGTVYSDSGYAIANYNACEVRLSGGTVSSNSGMGVVNMKGGNAVISNGATVTASAGIAIYTNDNLAISGGTIHSDSGIALISFAPAGSDVTVSGGTISSKSNYCVANCDAGNLTISGTAVFSTESGDVCLLNQGTGTSRINGGVLTSEKAELYNSGAGKIEINSGTYGLVINSNPSGKLVINGGSVKAVQGATPTNSAGTPLSFYGITLTDGSTLMGNTSVAAGELIITPAVSYGFSGVKTDASGTVYLWLPSTSATANFKRDSIDVSGGIVAGKTNVLPNYTARVTVKLNDETWDNPYTVVLQTRNDSVLDTSPILPDGDAAKEGGVFEFSGLKPGQDYYIWGNGTTGLLYSGEKITSRAPNATVSFYELKVTAGEGIDYVFYNSTLIQGAKTFIQANVKSGYTFDKWKNTTGGEPVLATSFGIIEMNGKRDLTAYATLNTYDGSVTLNKDNSAWTGSGKTVTLSTSQTDEAGVGYKTVSVNADGIYSFTGLSPLVTYYVWMDGKYTGQAVTTNNKNVVLDYYTVALNFGANIASVSGGGVYLKGTEITVSATVQTGDYVFSRWQNTTGGALVSTANQYKFPVNGTVGLTAVSGSTKYIASVTLKKDGADWSASPRNIVLSTSGTELAGTVTGTVAGNTYTFANLPNTGTYFVWDAQTVTNTGKQIRSTSPSAELEYFTVSVTPDSNISVMGAGAYLKGSTVTLTAIPADYYRITGEGWTDGKYTISNISAAQTVNPAAALDTYTGTVSVKKDNADWTNPTAAIALSISGTDAEVGKLTTNGASSVFTFADLDPTKTYYVWADGTYTGRVLSRAASAVTLNYYSVSVTPTNVTVTGGGNYLAGSSVTLTATPRDDFDFMGWYSGSTLLSTDTTYTVSGISSKQELTAEESNTFSAKVSLIGASGRDIKLSTSNTDSAGAVSGTGSGPYTFSGLIRGTTYFVFDGSTYTNKTITKVTPNATLRYYTVDLTAGTGISGVSGGGAYLEGSTVAISAATESGYAFNNWSGTVNLETQDYTISNINKDYALTTSAYMPYSGASINISSGTITISDSTSYSGKIKVMQSGSYIADNIAPSQAITITGTSTTDNNYRVIVNAVNGVTLMLQDLSISVNQYSNGLRAMDVSTSGNVTLILSGTNTLYASGEQAVALFKEGEGVLTIQSIDGTPDHILYATGSGFCSAGIGNRVGGNVKNIIINSGTVIANGGGAGIGAYNGKISGITINGGSVTANSIGSVKDPWSSNTTLTNVIINGGDVIVETYFGGGTTSNIFFNGGSLNAANIGTTPTNGSGVVAYKVTLSTRIQNKDVSQSLTIAGQDGGLYSTTDMRTTDDASGNVYIWLPDGTYTATLGTSSKIFTVNGGALSVSLQPTLSVNMPLGTTTEGVTASVNLSPNVNINAGNTITATVALSGTAQKPGTYSVGLTGTGITVAAQTLDVTKGQSVNESMTLSFIMPASNVADLALTLSLSEAAKYNVSYYNGSTLIGSAAYYDGDTYTLMDGRGLIRTGYTFGGWGVSGDQTMGAYNVTHAAVWIPNTYIVEFHNDSATTTQSITYAADAVLNGSVTKPGYTLSGWATSSGGPKVYNVNATVKNLTAVQGGKVNLYAVWQAQTYSVSFEGGGGTGSMATQSFLHDIAQELAPNGFARTGYTFAGWKDGETTYVDGQSITATGNISLTAQWDVNSYRVVFNGNGANGGTTMANQSFSYDESKNLTNNTFTRTGYAFTGWAATSGDAKIYDNGEAVKNLTTDQNSTVNLYAVWTPNTYSVSFDAGTGTGTMDSQTHTYDAAQALTDNAFVRTGYSFGGWNTLANGTGLSYADKSSVINLAMTGSVTLYAQWTADAYSLAFNSNNGVGSMANQNFATGDSGAVSANRFVKPGYTFDGWNTKADGGGTNYAADATLMSLNNLTAASPTLYAKWRANNYTVSFNANGGTGSMADQSFAYDAPENLTTNSFARGSDAFLGWSTSATAETATYNDGQLVGNLSTIADGKVTLYAVWRVNTYEVRFDANGGSGDMLPQTIGRSTATSLNANAFTRSGYSFTGWNTNINGSGVRYANEQQVTNLPGESVNSITLYAQWTESVRYNLNGTVRDSGGALQSGATVKLMQGSTIVAQTMTGADGSYFFGNLKSGSYNVVAAKDGKTVTKLLVIAGNMIQDMTIPAAVSNNSVLIVTNEPSADNIALTVGGLDDLASSESADITMIVTAKVEDDGDGEQNAIKEKSGSQTVGIYLDMTVKMGSVTQASTSNVLEIVIPFNFNGKTDINVYRYHGVEAAALDKLIDKPISPVDSTFYLDSANGLIYVYASKFSTYAVAYTGVSSGGSIGGGGTPTHAVKIDTAGIMGGSVKADKSTAVSGEKVTITVTPDKDHKFSGLSIVDASGKQITFADNGDGTYTFAMPASAVTVRLFFGAMTNGDFLFVDVPETHWARKAVAWANDKGLFSGTSGTTFGPGISTTRGMVVTVLWRMEKEPSVMQHTAFADVSTDAYYGKAVDWANKDGVVMGYGNGLFGPSNTITREQMAAILYRYAQLKGYDLSKRIELDSFTDGGKTAGYAKTAMEWAVANNLISGKENNILDPNGNATRAEVATILMRFTEQNR